MLTQMAARPRESRQSAGQSLRRGGAGLTSPNYRHRSASCSCRRMPEENPPPRNPALRARLPPGAGAPPDGSPPQPGTAAPRPARLPSTRSPLRHVPSPGEMVSISTPISALSSARQPWARLGSARPDPQCRHAPPRPADWGLPCCPSAARSQCRAGAGRQGRGGGPPAPTRRSPGARVCCAVRCGAMLRCAMLCCAMLCTAVLCCAVQRGEGSGTPALRHRPQL